MRIRIVLAVGFTLTALAVLIVLQHSPLSAVTSNGAQAVARLGVIQKAGELCHSGEALPRDISAIRLSFGATTGPRIFLTVSSGGRVVTAGTVGSAWYGSAVTVPVRPLSRAYSDVTICAHFGALAGDVGVLGEPSGTLSGRSRSIPGQVRVVYLRPDGKSWWSLAGSVIDHMALGRAASGTWIVFPIVALITAAIGLASLVLVRELR
jgi:hypothetical protein